MTIQWIEDNLFAYPDSSSVSIILTSSLLTFKFWLGSSRTRQHFERQKPQAENNNLKLFTNFRLGLSCAMSAKKRIKLDMPIRASEVCTAVALQNLKDEPDFQDATKSEEHQSVKLENMPIQASESSTAVPAPQNSLPDLKNESEFENATKSEEHQSVKLGNMPIQASESSTAVPAPASQGSLPDLKDESEFEDATGYKEHQSKKHQAKYERSYDEFLIRPRDFYQIAVDLWIEHRGLDVLKPNPGTDVLDQFFDPYNPGVTDRSALWSLVFKERQGPGGRLQFKATIIAHSLRDREFKGRDWYSTKRLAQNSAVKSSWPTLKCVKLQSGWLRPRRK